MQSHKSYRRSYGARTLQLEQLETRTLLSIGVACAAGAADHAGLAVEVGELVPSTGMARHEGGPALNMGKHAQLAQGGHALKSEHQADVRLMANLADPTGVNPIIGHAQYRSEQDDGQTKILFTVAVEGATAGETLPVSVDGIVVGQIVVGAEGEGRLALSSNPKNGNVQPLPADFPAITAGSVVTVGDAVTGTLATPGHHGHEGDDEDSTEVKLTAALADPAGVSTITGLAQYKSEQEDGQTEILFKVTVSGATSGETLAVAVDGIAVGQIVVGEDGTGQLALSSNAENPKYEPLPADFPAVTAGSVVTVGDAVTGTLGAPGDHAKLGEADEDSAEVELTAALADPTGVVATTGRAQYTSEEEDGLTKILFRVSVKGATPGETLPVTIDGTLVGEIVVNAKGRGRLTLSSDPPKNPKFQPLPADFPAVAAGSVVMVGDAVVGTLEVPLD